MSWFLPGDPALAPPPASVGLLVDLFPPPHWHDAVRSLARYARVSVATPGGEGGDEVDAWLASSPAAPGLDRARASGKPVAVLGPEAAVSGLDVRAVPPVTPFVRSRWRRRFGLPPRLVVDAAEVPDDLRPTALAVAAAVIAGGDHLLEALAWGAPTVTDPAAAAAAGARAGKEVLVGGPADAASLAADLAADLRRASALGRAGRRLVERRGDPLQAAAALRQALGIAVAPTPVERRLDELWTPPDAPIRRRAAELVALARP